MFVDRDNNGQVIVKLMTDAVRVRCSTLGYKIPGNYHLHYRPIHQGTGDS